MRHNFTAAYGGVPHLWDAERRTLERGSDLPRVNANIARGGPIDSRPAPDLTQHAFVQIAEKFFVEKLAAGIEPATCGLQNRCSAN